MKNTMRKMMLGMALVAGVLGTGAVAANAAPLVFQAGYGADYVPACPGDGYVWVAGYYNGGYWIPGEWVFRGHPGFGFRAGYGFYRDYGRGFAGYDRGRGFDRGYDRGNDRGYGRGFDRGNLQASRGFDHGNGRGFEGGRGGGFGHEGRR